MKNPDEPLIQAEACRFIQVLKGIQPATSKATKKEEEIRLFQHLLYNLGAKLSASEVAAKVWPGRKGAVGHVHRVVKRLRDVLDGYNRQRRADADWYLTFDLPKKDESGRRSPGYRLTYNTRKRPSLGIPALSTWKPFRWRIEGGADRKVPQHLWLPNPIEASFALHFDVTPTPWEPPQCPGYTILRQQCWATLHERDSEVFDGDVWRVRGVTPEGRNELNVSVQPSKWLDYYGTNLKLGNEKEKIRLRTREVTIDEWLKTVRGPDGFLREFANAGNSLAVNILLITSDGFAIIVQQMDKHSLSPLDWVASSSGTVDLPEDSKSLNPDQLKPDPWRTAFVETRGEVGVQIKTDHIQWVAFAVGLRMGSPALLGEIRLNEKFDQVYPECWNNRKDKHETAEIKPLKLDPDAILDALEGKDEEGKPRYRHRTYFELSLALALARRGKAEILQDT